MLSRVLFLQISLMLFGLTTSFINVQVQRNMQLSGNKWMKNEVSSQLYAVNKDLFSGKALLDLIESYVFLIYRYNNMFLRF